MLDLLVAYQKGLFYKLKVNLQNKEQTLGGAGLVYNKYLKERKRLNFRLCREVILTKNTIRQKQRC